MLGKEYYLPKTLILIFISLQLFVYCHGSASCGQIFSLQQNVHENNSSLSVDVQKIHDVPSASICIQLCHSAGKGCVSGTFDPVEKTCILYNSSVETTASESSDVTYFEKIIDVRCSVESSTELLDSYHAENISSADCCQQACSINQSCVAVYYDDHTSSCFMSGEASVVNYTENDRKKVLVKMSSISDLSIYWFSKMLARGDNVNMTISSVDSSRPASKAADGIYEPTDAQPESLNIAYSSGSHKSPWIQAELEMNHHILGVEIWDRSKSANVYNNRLANVRVTVGKSDASFDDPPEDEICNYLPGQPPADQFLVTCHTRMFGKYVRITAVEVNDHINIYEMEIHGLIKMTS